MESKCLSSDVWKHWDKRGKTEFILLFRKCVSNSLVSPTLQSNHETAQCVYELLSKCIKEVLKKDQVCQTIGELLPLHPDITSIVLDVLNTLDCETQCASQEERQNFCNIVRDLETLIPEKLLKERLEIDTLQEVGTLKNKHFHTKFIRIKTKLYYKQKKFNLLREESEGYSRLITELNQGPSPNFTAPKLLEAIKSLVGCFNLDPNRVLDVILEAFENNLTHVDVFTQLLKDYADDPKLICEILGFKYIHYLQNEGGLTPNRLYLVTAQLLHHKVIQVEDIYPWLMPNDSYIEQQWEKKLEDSREYVRKLSVLSTKPQEEPEPEKENIKEKYDKNQKFGLIEATLQIGAWSTSQELFKRLPLFYIMDQPPIAFTLCSLLHCVIEPLYSKTSVISGKVKRKPRRKNVYVKPIESFIEFKEIVAPMLQTLGPSLHFDPVLMYKVIRLCKYGLKEYKNKSNENNIYNTVIILLDTVILPSLSYMDCNCSIAEEVWAVLENYTYQVRYCLYSRWKNVTPNSHARLLRKNGDALKNIKNIMKRVSKENIKPVGRLIGKCTHASPGVLFDYVLIQIQMYDNMIGPVVDSLKFLTSLSYDVLGYCLIETLVNTSVDKDRFKYDGTSISMWLQSLSAFCGAAYKKYNVELTGLLQYVANQLKSQKSLDLLILREVVSKMTGIEAAEELTLDQLHAMSGGEILKSEGGYFSQVRNTKKSSQRLKEALCEQDLGVSLCLLMAQQRYSVVYRETEQTHLKLVGKLYDQCQDTLVQFGTFLGSTLSVDEYDSRFPPIHAMLADYHINADVAFFLARPILNHSINQKYEILRKADPNHKKMTQTVKQQKYCEAVAEVMEPLIESVRPLHPQRVWEDVTPQFLVTFWSLTMYDLHLPLDSYQKEISKLKTSALQAMDSKDMASSKGKKEQERFTALMEKLQEEKKKQQEHIDKVMARLKLEKDSWFGTRAARSAKNETIMQFLQLCIFPRCIFTSIDALYCAKFIHVIHTLKTANFSTLLCIDRLFCDITYSVTLCTENEANRYGRFLCSMLEILMRWHSDVNIYNKECSNHPGFVTKFRVSNQFNENNDQVSFENYRHVVHKWHYKITKAMMICLESKDYTQIRNSLIILIKILPYFPVLPKLSNIIEKRIEKVQAEEKNQRQDLFTLATSYAGHLKAKAPQLVKESDFHQVAKKIEKKKEEVKVVSTTNIDTAKSTKLLKKEDIKREPTPISKDRSDKERAKEEAKAQRDVERAMKEEAKQAREEMKRSREKERLEKEERSYREERYQEAIPLSKDEGRTVSYYQGHYEDNRELSSVSNSTTHSQEVEERELKRRKLEASTSSKHRPKEDWAEPEVTSTTVLEKSESRERHKASKNKERKEKKSSRKRERGDEELMDSTKIRKEEKSSKSSYQNGDSLESSHREKRHAREKVSPPPLLYERDRERSYERRDRTPERQRESSRDRHRRSERIKERRP